MCINNERREYFLSVKFNKRHFSRVVIDAHYEIKHPEINDDLVLEIIKLLNGAEVDAVGDAHGFQYFAHELYYQQKPYRIVLTYCEQDFLGVINAFRIKEIKL